MLHETHETLWTVSHNVNHGQLYQIPNDLKLENMHGLKQKSIWTSVKKPLILYLLYIL